MSSLQEFLAIRRAISLWEGRADAELGAVHGLGLSEFGALFHLAEAPGGRLRRVDLARRLAVTPSGVTRLLAPLERRHIVGREADGQDARSTYAVLTKSGRSLVKDATVTAMAVADDLLGALPKADRLAFNRLAVL